MLGLVNQVWGGGGNIRLPPRPFLPNDQPSPPAPDPQPLDPTPFCGGTNVGFGASGVRGW